MSHKWWSKACKARHRSSPYKSTDQSPCLQFFAHDPHQDLKHTLPKTTPSQEDPNTVKRSTCLLQHTSVRFDFIQNYAIQAAILISVLLVSGVFNLANWPRRINSMRLTKNCHNWEIAIPKWVCISSRKLHNRWCAIWRPFILVN